MVFSSLEFLFLFLPATLFLYFLAPARAKNGVLLLTSLIFYGAGEPAFLPLMLLTILVNYLLGLGMERVQEKKRRLLLWAAVLFDVSLLFFFKYASPLLGLFLPSAPEIPLPIGISFYTFQALSYVIDVYRREVAAEKNPLTFGTYVSLFPQLVAGPIVRYDEISRELSQRRHSLSGAAEGIRQLIVGLSKKGLLANAAGSLWEIVRAAAERSVLGAWTGLLGFTFQIYFDFSAYSDMAVGLGKLFGFTFPENFRYPYVARSVTDFWRRWHITLSSWFRSYVYIPLGGNRVRPIRKYANLLIVWLLTGLWHGASPNYPLWGLYFFFLLTLEKSFLGKYREKLPIILQRILTFLLVMLGWLIFVTNGEADGLTLSEGAVYLDQLFGVGAPPVDVSARYELTRHLPLLLLMAVCATPLWRRIGERLPERGRNALDALSYLLCLPLLLLSISSLVYAGYNPFLYFRF